MMQQYFRAKEEHPGVLIAMRVGDFYEFYGEDAETAAAALEITLTGREDAEAGRIPMAGVPFHSVEKYLARLLQKGLKVAICDQLEDPKKAKGLVKRGVTRVLTPGTALEDSMLSSQESSFLVAICLREGKAGLAVLEPSTGEFRVTEIGGEQVQEALLHELAVLRPSELLLGPDLEQVGTLVSNNLGSSLATVEAPPLGRASRKVLDQFDIALLHGFGLDDKPNAVVAAAMVLNYAEQNKLSLDHIEPPVSYSLDSYLQIDLSSRRSLELTVNLSDGSRKFTLLSVLDDTVTTMGSRLLRKWIERPLLDSGEIRERLDAVDRFVRDVNARGDLREALRRVQDIERLVSRASAGIATPRDLGALRSSLMALPQLAEPLRRVGVGRIQVLREKLAEHHDLRDALVRGLVQDPPQTSREGGLVPEGFDLELDKLRDLARNGRTYIAALEAEERDKTGIPNLKVGFNSVFGYFLEVSKTNIAKVPDHYIRKQTTANGERYITAELKEHESQVLGAEEKAFALEADLFAALRSRIADQARELLETARALAEIDVLSTLADVAVRRDYIRPSISDSDDLMIVGGRHPVVEAHGSRFVPNDLALEEEGARVMVLTGPNMSGKSTFLRQTALIAILAQIGSFVPAKTCTLGICDRVFARIGAKDELAMGQSTFMVEMVESANILNHASRSSLVILDEVGRGTSTFDGLSIAWAMVERLAEIGAKTLFATHYHQLNTLADEIPGIVNFRASVEEKGDDIVWTHRILPGGADRSYGIHVARMAGIPPSVLRRAAEVLEGLEQQDAPQPVQTQKLQLTLFEMEEPEVLRQLGSLDLNALTPLQALQLLDDWKRRWGR